MSVLDDVLGPSLAMLGPQGVKGTVSVQSQPQPKKKVQQAPQTPPVAKPAPDPLDEQLAQVSASDPLDAQLAAVGNGPDATVQKLHADYKSGHLATEEKAKSIADPERRSADVTGSPLDAALASATQGGETALSGIPGASMALAGLRHLTTGESYRDAQAEQANEIGGYEHEHPLASTALKVLTAAPLAARLPGGLVKGGALYGAAANALDPNLDESAGQRIVNTGIGGLEGALTGKLLGTAGHVVQKVGATTGATDALSRILSKAGIDAGEALGTRGAVNQTAADRAAITDAVGANESPADLLDRRVKEGRAVASPLYDAAKAQANTLEGAPAAVKSRLDEILTAANQKALPGPGQSAITRADAAEGLANHDYTQGPPPTLEQAVAHDYTSTTPPTEPFRDNGLMQSDFTQERPVQLRAANDVNVRQEPSAVNEVPSGGPPDRFQAAEDATQKALANSHVQMQIKSLLGDAPSLKGEDPGSYDVLRKVQEAMNREYGSLKAIGKDNGPYWHELNGARADVNAALLAKAPALADANAAFAQEVGTPREGITKGQTMGLNPAGKAAFKRSPDAITQWIESAPTAEGQAARASAVSQGVAAQIGQRVAGVPLASGTRGALDLPILQSSEAGAGGRALLDPAKRQALESVLGSLDQRSAQEAVNMAPRGKLARLFRGPAEYNYLAQPSAVGPLRETANAMQNGSLDLSRFTQGRSTLGRLQDIIRALGVAKAGQVAAP